MPAGSFTTTDGTPYTVGQYTLTDHGVVTWGVGDEFASEPNLPAILYTHGSVGPPDQFATSSGWKPLREKMIKNGWCWIEGEGGATTGAGNWGNTAARLAYPACLDYVTSGILDIEDIVIDARSMGGFVGLWLATQSDIAGDISGIINNSGCSTMLYELADPGLPSDSPARKDWMSCVRYFGRPLWEAYSKTSYDETAIFLADTDFCPENWAPSVWATIKLLNCFGTADHTVPFDSRGAARLEQIWTTAGTAPLLYQRSPRVDGDHSVGNGSYLDVSAQFNFMLEVTGRAEIVPEIKTYSLCEEPYLYLNGGKYPIVLETLSIPPT